MELCDCSLLKYIRTNRDFNIKTKIDLAVQMSRGLAHLHQCSLCHMGIKPSNIMLKTNPDGTGLTVKLTDMGLTKSPESSADYDAVAWIAPELFSSPFRFTMACDIWTLGCIIYYAFTRGRHPFENPEHRTLADKAFNITENKFNLKALQQQEMIDPETNQRLQSLILLMINKTAESRPNAQQIVDELVNLEKASIPPSNQQQINRTIGQISWNDQVVIGKSLNSFVFPGMFNGIPCVVKRAVKDKGELSEISIHSVLEAIALWQRMGSGHPVIQCLGSENDQDFWFVIILLRHFQIKITYLIL